MLRMHLLRLLFRSSHVRFRSPTGTARFAPLKAAQLRESAYVIAFTADGSHVLLAPRDDGAGLEIPGGGRDARESIRDAALRETFEETGVAIAGELRKLLVHLDWFFDESDGRMYVSKQHFFIASLPPRTPVSDQSLLTETSSAGDHLNPNDADVIALAFQKRL